MIFILVLLIMLTGMFLVLVYNQKTEKEALNTLYVLGRHTKAKLRRSKVIRSLETEKFDILVIGGGCIGTGCALDAATRGLKVAVIEALDFGSETSSRSTKLLHGGIRYLQKAISCFSASQMALVMNALRERATVMRIAPYLTRTVKIVVPICKAWTTPFYYILLKLYDWLSVGKSLGRSYLIPRSIALMYFGSLKQDNVFSATVYHDGMMMDSRMVAMLARTASFYGATAANYVKFQEFVKSDDGNITGVIAIDQISGKAIRIKSNVVICAAGAFTDDILAKEEKENILNPSIGTHIVVEPGFGPENIGLLDPCTTDNRVVFILPWQGHTLIGSTETKGSCTSLIKPTSEDVDFLLEELRKYTKKNVDRTNVTSVWSGIRPLIKDTSKSNTESIVRGFKVIDNTKGLVTVVGGKWTTFRSMAEEAVDVTIRHYQLCPMNNCLTNSIQIIGSRKYSRDLHYEISRILGVDLGYASHLLHLYGDQAFKLRKYLARYPKKISTVYPFTEGEVIYCIENELAITASDIVNMRFGVGFYDVREAARMADKIHKLFENYFESKGDSSYSKEFDRSHTSKMLESLGYGLINSFQQENN